MGDPAGIGPEITAKAWLDLRAMPHYAFALCAPPDIFTDLPFLKDIPTKRIDSLEQAATIFPDALPILALDEPINSRKPSADNAPAIIRSIERSVALCLSRQADALITNPIAKALLYQAGFSHAGHTEFLAQLTQNPPENLKIKAHKPRPVMMLTAKDLRVGLVTIHQPLKTVASAITPARIIDNAVIMIEALRRDFGIDRPRLALCGLNPHAGENGSLGDEEHRIINPAAQKLRAQGFDVTDAQSADTLFHAQARQNYDAVLAMYHDQGLIPVKTLDFYGGVNITLGLPIIRSSPDHGTAFAIAGRNQARPDSLIAAIKQARAMANQRFYSGNIS